MTISPGQFLGWAISVWLATVAALIFYQTLTGRISLKGLFTVDGKRFAPERLQLFIVAVITLGAYLQGALSATEMPDISPELIALFAGSHAVYLGGKIARMP